MKPNLTNYRSLHRSRHGWILGICQGLADFFEFPVLWLRVLVVILTCISGVWPMVVLYIVAGIFIKPAPVIVPQTDDDWEFYNSMAMDRSLALARLKHKFDRLDRRARRLEGIVTGKDYDWDQRLETGN